MRLSNKFRCLKNNWLLLFFSLALTFKANALVLVLGLPFGDFASRTLASLGFALLIFGPAVLFKKNRTRSIYLFFWVLVTSILLVGNYLYFSYGRGFLSASLLPYAWQISSLGTTILSLVNLDLLLFFFDLPILVLNLFWPAKSVSEHLKKRCLNFGGMAILAFVFYGSFFMIANNEKYF